jgi:hypothetical protein
LWHAVLKAGVILCVGNSLTNWGIINLFTRDVVDLVKIRRGIFWGEIKHNITVIAIVLFAYNLTELGIRPNPQSFTTEMKVLDFQM